MRRIFCTGNPGASDRLARVHDSIDQPGCPGEFICSQRDLPVAGAVDRGGDPVAKVAQLAGAEHERPDRARPPR